jgi:hypothetical protein
VDRGEGGGSSGMGGSRDWRLNPRVFDCSVACSLACSRRVVGLSMGVERKGHMEEMCMSRSDN